MNLVRGEESSRNKSPPESSPRGQFKSGILDNAQWTELQWTELQRQHGRAHNHGDRAANRKGFFNR